MKCLMELKIVTVKDYAHFLRNANTNHALWYYWSILDLLLQASDDTTDFADVFSVRVDVGAEQKCILVLENAATQSANSSYVVSILEQQVRHYKQEVREGWGRQR